jgi:hypothetical protein
MFSDITLRVDHEWQQDILDAATRLTWENDVLTIKSSRADGWNFRPEPDESDKHSVEFCITVYKRTVV